MARGCCLLIALIGLLAGTALAAPLEKCTRALVIGWEEWAPYHFKGPDGKMHGYAIEVAEEMARRAGCPLEYRMQPWKRTLADLAAGDIDMAMEVLPNAERAAFAWLSTPYSPTNEQLWGRSDSALRNKIHTLADLNRFIPLHVGVVAGDSYGEMLDAWVAHPPAGFTIDMAPSLAVNIRKLELGRLDLIVGEGMTTRMAIDEAGLAQTIIPLEGAEWQVSDACFAFSRKSVSEKLFLSLQTSLKSMVQDGKLKAIQRKYRNNSA